MSITDKFLGMLNLNQDYSEDGYDDEDMDDDGFYDRDVDVSSRNTRKRKEIDFIDDTEEAPKKQVISVFIGPEGGFEEAEVEFAKENGVIPVSLGKRILRT